MTLRNTIAEIFFFSYRIRRHQDETEKKQKTYPKYFLHNTLFLEQHSLLQLPWRYDSEKTRKTITPLNIMTNLGHIK